MVTKGQILDLFLIASLFLLFILYLCDNINIDESQTPSPLLNLRSSFKAHQPDGVNPNITTGNKGYPDVTFDYCLEYVIWGILLISFTISYRFDDDDDNNGKTNRANGASPG